MKDTGHGGEPTGDSDVGFDDFFRDGAAPSDAQLLWQLGSHEALLDALRALFHGPATLVRLRVWVFLELMSLPQGRIARDDLNRHFHLLRDEALELVLKRLRDAGLLAWDATSQQYALPPLAQQLMGLLSPLARPAQDDGDLTALLAGVAGAYQLGTLDAAQLQHLQAQLARLHDEFADAIASGSEFQLRQADRRFQRALQLVERASQAMSAITTEAQARGEAALERLARELGLAQARLLSMASQFNRALQQADRQRVTLGSTGVTTTDVKRWLQQHGELASLANGALAVPVAPVFVTPHELLDTAEAELARERVQPLAPEALPPARAAPEGRLAALALPAELDALVLLLDQWHAKGEADRPIADAVVGGRYSQAAYRAQLLPLLGDSQAQALQGRTGDLARQPWRVQWLAELQHLAEGEVAAISAGTLTHCPSTPNPLTSIE